MNNALIMLWVFTISLMIFFLYLFFSAIWSYYHPVIINTRISLNPACQPLFNTLADATNAKVCIDGNRYVPSLGLIVSPNAIPYINACSTACTIYNASEVTCQDPIENAKLQKCLEETAPIDCSSLSYPVAYIGTNYYYAAYVGDC